ncbi:hypothetical protein PGT21_002187 [Puccinia graminis f. sp. tritici]|uniref:Suppressor of G2 allele of SKP1 n=2 Tax=Puccinia graminis f. sp. tritici TaxID=56615 RepID=E3KVA8_PUCGT|nr:uncharacterized protein PGTG_14287 [Puccinia graminis f. sp. tritici CRL 75-36-700-3]EFP88203.2 hypothetical protein PGTG_14287 [Puccinia graminis f. sp. tritici CRL 75-36-700-3]KAA1082403.1 hypothetical protein PGT21_002187 [Puccinia graminis f. sp. tritici]KAA1133704.1 hypothetical protein PGTUg99_031878 [Puccinia graminis f. sp. tritici]
MTQTATDSPDPQSQPRIRHEWYQTDVEVVLSVFVKNTKSEDINCDFGPRSISLNYKLPTNGSEGCFDLDPLSYEIEPSQCSWKSLPSKIDIRLKKKVPGIKWLVIEGDQADLPAPTILQESSTATDVTRQPAYPSSARRKTNWDQLANSVEKEEEEVIKNLKDPNAGGDRAVNELFQKLYADATDEQKKAMMKSYVESNGTALSTDWSDVSKKKVETRPPDSMVAKTWKE